MNFQEVNIFYVFEIYFWYQKLRWCPDFIGEPEIE